MRLKSPNGHIDTHDDRQLVVNGWAIDPYKLADALLRAEPRLRLAAMIAPRGPGGDPSRNGG
jgi:hypothetical protein